MSGTLLESLFWIVVFVILFFGLRRLQNRKKANKDAARDDSK